jgi:ribose transport system permease protein
MTSMTNVMGGIKNNKILLRWVLNNIVWVILILLIVVFSFTISGFMSVGNYINIIYHSVFIGLIAIGVSLTMISGTLDLSVESMAGLGSILSAYLCGSSAFASGIHLNPFIGLLVVMAIGALLGLINAFFILKLNINAFLVTLAAYIYVRGIAEALTNGQGVSLVPNSFRLVDTIKILDFPFMVYIMLILYIVFQFILQNTRFGKHIYIVGGNPAAAYNFGINVKKTITWVLVLSGILAGLTGWLMTARTNGSTPAAGIGYLFEALAAVIIGGVSMTGGVGSLAGVIGGVLLLSAIHSALNIVAISPFVTDIIRGLLVLVAISLDSIKRAIK